VLPMGVNGHEAHGKYWLWARGSRVLAFAQVREVARDCSMPFGLLYPDVRNSPL
jgi:hypothetical protein